jgi:hypothetical protein
MPSANNMQWTPSALGRELHEATRQTKMKGLIVSRRQLLAWVGAAAGGRACPVWAAGLESIAPQPYFAAVSRALEALAKLGAPVAAPNAQSIAALSQQNDAGAIEAAERILDRYTLAQVDIEADGHARVTTGGAQRTLFEQGWRLFLVRVSNTLAITDPLTVSASLWSVSRRSTGASRAGLPDATQPASYIASAWWMRKCMTPRPSSQRYRGLLSNIGWFSSTAAIAARIGTTRTVAVELIVNGITTDKATLVADGTPRSIHLKTSIARSAWIALRIMPSAHTYPIFVQVGAKPIRASRRSAQSCRVCIEKLWEVKSPFIREGERRAATDAFGHARAAYDAIARECEIE